MAGFPEEHLLSPPSNYGQGFLDGRLKIRFEGENWSSEVHHVITMGSKAPTTQLEIELQNFGMELNQRLEVLSTYDAPTRAWAWHYYAHENEKAALFSKEFQEGLLSSIRHFQAFDPSTNWSPETFIAQDRDFYMPQEMLRKVDRMTMAYSVEGRSFAAPAVHTLKNFPMPT